MKPYNVLHVLGTAQREATAHLRIVGPLTRALDPERYTTHAWFLLEEGPLMTELEEAGAQVRFLKWRRGARDPAGAWRFLRTLLTENFEIIHQHFGGRSVQWLARAATSASIVVHLHGRVSESDSPPPAQILVPGADVVIANSYSVARQVRIKRPHVVYPGVSIQTNDATDLTVRKKEHGKILGTAGRLVPIKGIAYLIQAMALLRDQIPEVRLEIAGAGPERLKLEEEVRLRNLAGCVTFLGWQTDLTSALATWDVFVQPSLEEGFGIAVLEAMAFGLPVVAAAVGGLPELVEDGRTGRLVPPRNAPELAACLHALLLNPEQRLSMGAAGQVRAREHFSADRMTAGIQKLYDDIISERSRVGYSTKVEME